MQHSSPSALLSEIIAQFPLFNDGNALVSRIPTGHINETYRIDCQRGAFILQGLNTQVFQNPEDVMHNIVKVCEHLARKAKSPREVLRLVPTITGDSFLAAQGAVWRAFYFVEDCRTYDVAPSPAIVQSAAYGFGMFATRLSDFEVSSLAVTIPHFHDPIVYQKSLQEAVAEDRVHRAEAIQEELGEIFSYQSLLEESMGAKASGALALRVVHNDTKLNNVMLDEVSGEAVCVIDLDTVMPGFLIDDFGDLVRSATCVGAEDNPHHEQTFCDKELFEAAVKGYLQATSSILTSTEKSWLSRCGIVISVELAMRFLTDYLNGDTYFQVTREGQNLDRVRVQLAMARSMSEQQGCFDEMVKQYG